MPRDVYKGCIENVNDLIGELLRVLRFETSSYLQNVCHIATLESCKVSCVFKVTQIQSIQYFIHFII